jgi:hypothetical protein
MGFFDSIFGTSDPSKGAMKYLNQIPGMANNIYNPYIQAGQAQLPGLEEQYSMLMNDPGARMNQIGAGYQQSPGYQFAVQQALQGSGNAAAAGGMAGSPQHEQQNMTLANNLANQDYNQYLQNALGLYGEGLQGSQGLYSMGYGASNALADMLANAYGSQANLAYAGAANQNQARGGMFGNMAGLGMAALMAPATGGASVPAYFMKQGYT